MLSAGKYHLEVPTNPKENLEWRLRFLDAVARRGDRGQRAVRQMCRDDLVFYTNAFVFTFNPLIEPHVFPFILWDYQVDALRETAHYLFTLKRSVIWEKSRYQGATWMGLDLFDWAAKFHRYKKFLCISHNEDAVDNGDDDPDSLFWKLRFIHHQQPEWLSGKPRCRSLKFGYPETQSNITGTSTSARSGVGGRATGVLLDEFGKMMQDYEIFGQTADTGPRLIISTHYGLGTAFYTYTRPDAGIHKIVMHWSQHPTRGRGLYKYEPESSDAGPDGIVRLDDYPHPPDYPFDRSREPLGGARPGVRSPWYDLEAKERPARDRAMHLDVNPEGASAQFFEPAVIERLRRDTTRPPLWTGDLIYDRVTGKPDKLLKRAGGPLQLWVLPDTYGRIKPSSYGAGSDIAFGGGHTPSTLAIGDALAEPASLVAMYADAFIETTEFAAFVAALCRLFRDINGTPALLCWESQGPAGGEFGKEMVEQLGYENSWAFEDDEIKRRLRPGPKRWGWPAMPKQKNLLLKELRTATGSGRLIVPSDEMLKECLGYQFNDRGDKVFHGKSENTDDPQAGTVNHGDRVVAVGLMWKMLCKLGAREAVEVKTERQGHAYMSHGWMLEQAERQRLDRLEDYGRAAYLRRR